MSQKLSLFKVNIIFIPLKFMFKNLKFRFQLDAHKPPVNDSQKTIFETLMIKTKYWFFFKIYLIIKIDIK